MLAKNKFFFRVDASSSIGLGHIMRCIALARILELKFAVHFLLNNAAGEIIALLDKRWSIDIVNGEEPEALLSLVPEYSCIVLDGYKFDTFYQRKLKERGFKVIIIDDLCSGEYYADIIINHSEGADREKYKVSNNCSVYIGSQYAILRSPFLEVAGKQRVYPDISRSLTICYGGADPCNYLSATLSAFLKMPDKQFSSLHLITGAAYKHFENLKKYVNTISDMKVVLYRNLNANDMRDLFIETDLAITSASTIAYETCACRLPTAIVQTADNQKLLYSGMVSSGAVIGLGDSGAFFSDNLSDKLYAGIEQLELSKVQLGNGQKNMIDGKSGERIITLFNELIC